MIDAHLVYFSPPRFLPHLSKLLWPIRLKQNIPSYSTSKSMPDTTAGELYRQPSIVLPRGNTQLDPNRIVKSVVSVLYFSNCCFILRTREQRRRYSCPSL